MTITPIAFQNSGADVALDTDLKALHPSLENDIWQGVETYRATLNSAFDQLLLDLKRAGWNPDLISNSAANIAWFKPIVCVGALIIIFRDFRAETGDRWDLLLNDYSAKYANWVADAKLDYDEDEDGSVSEEEEETNKGVTLQR